MMKTDAKRGSQEQKENNKNARNAFKVLQKAATHKENLTGRILGDKDKSTSSSHKRKQTEDKGVQTGESVITAADLTSDEPSADYWKVLAEKRMEDLDESFTENEKLKDEIRIYKEMLNESRNLVEVLQEIMAEGEEEGEANVATEVAEEVTED